MSNRLIDVFPPDDQGALFVIALTAAANDIDQADHAARRANPQDDGGDPHLTHRNRFTFHIRRTLAHLFEGIAALNHWRQHEAAARSLLAALSPEGKERVKLVTTLGEKLGPDTLKGARHKTSHYPSPGTKWEPDPVGEIADAIRTKPDTPAGFDVISAEVPPGEQQPRPRRLYRFADQMMLSMALGDLDPDPEKLREQLTLIDEAAVAFCALVDEVFDIYCKRRGLEFGG